MHRGLPSSSPDRYAIQSNVTPFPAGKNPNLAGVLSVAIPPDCGLSPISFPDRESSTFLREAHLASFVHLYIPIRSAHTLQAMPKAHFYAVKHIVIFTET